MNTERLLDLADLIEKQPHEPEYEAKAGFGMGQVRHECGTPSCIAGWANSLSGTLRKSSMSAAGSWLELTEDQADELFMPSFHDWSSITPAQAAACIRRLVRTGEVDWDAVL